MFKCRLWTGPAVLFLGKCVILVEHISTVALDTKTLYYRKEADKCPQSMRSDNSSFSQIPVCTASSISDEQNPEHLSANAFWPRDWQSRPMSRMMIGQCLSALWVFSPWPDDPGEDSKWSGSALVTHNTQAMPPWQFTSAMHTQKRCMILCQIFFTKIILRATKPPCWHPKS